MMPFKNISAERAIRSATLTVVSLSIILMSCGNEDVVVPSATPAEVQTSSISSQETEELHKNKNYDTRAFGGYGDAKGFAGETLGHGSFDTRELDGKPIVINFWFPSCPPCRAELPIFEEVYQDYGAPSGRDVQFIAIQQLGLDTPADGMKLLQEIGVSFPAMPDTDSAVQIGYDIFSFPTTVFLDRDHNQIRKWQGAINREKLVEYVEESESSIHTARAQESAGEALPATDSDTEFKAPTDPAERVDMRQFTPAMVFIGSGDAPGFSAETFTHGNFDTSELQGRPIVINFWYPSCPPCRAEIPNFEHAYQTYGQPSDGDVAFIGVQALILDSADEGEAFMQDIEATYPALPDVNSEIHIAYQVTAAPTTFFLDRTHNIVSVHQGYIRHDQLTEMLEFISKR